MITLLPPYYVAQEVTQDDLVVASIAWGFTLGFGWLTSSSAIKQTRQAYRRSGWDVLRNSYIWMLWLEIVVCLVFSIICWLHLKGTIPPSFAFYFCILTLWALQVQFLLQIIINRCGILLRDKKHVWRLKVGVAIVITAINISVYTIWIPARLQISQEYIWINEWWDRCEKGFYLLIDAALNIYFIRIVQRNLVQNGLQKYRTLVHFNIFIIGFSLGMDVLIIGTMSLKNTFVYMQFHPLAYTVKLKIEISMADLIVKIAKARNATNHGHSDRYVADPSSSNPMGSKTIDATASRHGTKISSHKPLGVSGTRRDRGNSIELSDITPEDASLARDLESGDKHGIYTTREVRIEFEESSHQSEGRGPSSEEQSTSQREEVGEEDTRPIIGPHGGGVVHVWNAPHDGHLRR
ncbi:hypothetical protein F4775DRAFT_527972 [Biscogniauxia sp. FL1348]|nr:hypothetical protein F4775DRAFT_527972 [Biscogniauxia sp. FL1348]